LYKNKSLEKRFKNNSNAVVLDKTEAPPIQIRAQLKANKN